MLFNNKIFILKIKLLIFYLTFATIVNVIFGISPISFHMIYILSELN